MPSTLRSRHERSVLRHGDDATGGAEAASRRRLLSGNATDRRLFIPGIRWHLHPPLIQLSSGGQGPNDAQPPRCPRHHGGVLLDSTRCRPRSGRGSAMRGPASNFVRYGQRHERSGSSFGSRQTPDWSVSGKHPTRSASRTRQLTMWRACGVSSSRSSS